MTREEANAKARERRLRRRARATIDNPIPHGTINGYMNYACRCWACSDARRDYFAKRVTA